MEKRRSRQNGWKQKKFNSNNFFTKKLAMFHKKMLFCLEKNSHIAQIISKSIFFVRYLQPVKYKVG